jgi:hypothetical protein
MLTQYPLFLTLSLCSDEQLADVVIRLDAVEPVAVKLVSRNDKVRAFTMGEKRYKKIRLCVFFVSGGSVDDEKLTNVYHPCFLYPPIYCRFTSLIQAQLLPKSH